MWGISWLTVELVASAGLFSMGLVAGWFVCSLHCLWSSWYTTMTCFMVWPWFAWQSFNVKWLLTVSEKTLVRKNIQRICSIASESTAKCTTSLSLSNNTVTTVQWENQQQKQHTLPVHRTVIIYTVIEKCTVKPTEQYKKMFHAHSHLVSKLWPRKDY
jgi:hypothetical protein